MKPAPFEQFIKSLLDNTNCADALRNLAEKNIPLQGNNLMSAVDSILLEESIAGQFDTVGYSDTKTQTNVLLKLSKVLHAISDTKCNDYLTVYICMKYVSDGYALTTEITKVLNTIWKKYE